MALVCLGVFLSLNLGDLRADERSPSNSCFDPIVHSSDLSFERLQVLLDLNPWIKQAEDLLECFPREFRSQFLLVYDSRGLQSECVSYQAPRVVFFVDSTEFVLSVVQSQPKPGCEQPEVEAYSYRPKEQGFEFRKIDFKAPQKMSAPNPETCLNCHGNDPRPIFDPYFLWSGVYGSNDDNVLVQALLRPGEKLPQESQEFFQFVENAPRAQLYRKLHWTPERKLTRALPAGQNNLISPYYRPNAYFHLLTAGLNLKRLQRLARQAIEEPFGEKILPGLLYALGCEQASAPAERIQNLSLWLDSLTRGAVTARLPLGKEAAIALLEKIFLTPRPESSARDALSELFMEPQLQRLSPMNRSQLRAVSRVLDRWNEAVPREIFLNHVSPGGDAAVSIHEPHHYRSLSTYFQDLAADMSSLELTITQALLNRLGRGDFFEDAFLTQGAVLPQDGVDQRWKGALLETWLQAWNEALEADPASLNTPDYSRLLADRLNSLAIPLTFKNCSMLAQESLLRLQTYSQGNP